MSAIYVQVGRGKGRKRSCNKKQKVKEVPKILEEVMKQLGLSSRIGLLGTHMRP